MTTCGHRGCRGRRTCKAAPRPTTTLHTEDTPTMIKPPTYVAGPLGADGDSLTDMRLLALARLAVVEGRLPFTLAAHQGLLLGPGPSDRGRTAVLAELARSGAYLVGNTMLGELWLLEGPDGELGDVGRAALEGFQRAGRGRVTRRGAWPAFRAGFERAGDELVKLHDLVGAFKAPDAVRG